MTQQPAGDKRILRALAAQRYLSGEGIEIGALGTPLLLPKHARVRYVDRMAAADLYREYPEMRERGVVNPDIIDDGETLSSIPDGSLDFLAANHFLEHCENLLGTLRVHAAKLKPGGRLFYATPNRDFTFDRQRPVTPFEHLVEDDRLGIAHHRAAHYLEWATLVEGRQGAEAQVYAAALQDKRYSIHFHCWDAAGFFDFLARAVAYNSFPGIVAHFELNLHEILCVLTRTR